MSKKKLIRIIIGIWFVALVAIGCTENKTKDSEEVSKNNIQVTSGSIAQDPAQEQSTANTTTKSQQSTPVKSNDTMEYAGKSYKIITVDGGDMSCLRQPNVAVDIGYGDRRYWAFTNEYGQLIYVIADHVILQNDNTEPVNSEGRYYDDEAKVPGTEQEDFDQGHVIADSLGGVSNAYNITPQDSLLIRNGDQADMEEAIRSAGGCKYFMATVTYPDVETQIPSRYHYAYILDGEQVVEEFDNVSPDESQSIEYTDATPSELNELGNVDLDGNGKVSIDEAKAAGYSIPITKEIWLYKFMIDSDGDGVVGE